MTLPESISSFSRELARISGVTAIVIGGSWAKGTNKPDSDIDIALYYEPKTLPDLETLRQVANQYDDAPRPDILSPFGEWGPWINGGGWLSIKGQRVDLLYSNLEQVRFYVREALEGRSVLSHQPGHPHGFHSHMYAGQVHLCQILFDSQGEIARLKQLLWPYPEKLKAELIRDFLWQAGFALQVAEKGASRGDIFCVNGFLFDCAASLIQVLFALNEAFWLNEKGALDSADAFPIKPKNFKTKVETVLAHVGENPKELKQSLQRFEDLVSETRAIIEQKDAYVP